MITSIIRRLMEEDGVNFGSGMATQRTVRCVSRDHNDKKPSLSVNLARGVYHCHSCGLKGNPYTYLTTIRNMKPAGAMEVLKGLDATQGNVDHWRDNSPVSLNNQTPVSYTHLTLPTKA